MRRRVVRGAILFGVGIMLWGIVSGMYGHPLPGKAMTTICHSIWTSQQSVLGYQEWKKNTQKINILFDLTASRQLRQESFLIRKENRKEDNPRKDESPSNAQIVKENEAVLEEELATQVVGSVSFVFGESYQEEEKKEETEVMQEVEEVGGQSSQWLKSLKRTPSLNELLNHFYIVDRTTSIDKKVFPIQRMLKSDYTIKKDASKPQILIYHTHGASEGYKGKKPDEDGGIISMGNQLTSVLQEQYGYQVLHDKTKYDWIDGALDRSRAYAVALPAIRKKLQDNPSIQVVIDLHRDGVAKKLHTFTTIEGKKTAQVMFFNGLSRNRESNISYLKNKNLVDNLSFSLQMKMTADELYPGLTKPIYLKGYRYNLHLAQRALLVELGNQNNTYAEAERAIPKLAKVLAQVLSQKPST